MIMVQSLDGTGAALIVQSPEATRRPLAGVGGLMVLQVRNGQLFASDRALTAPGLQGEVLIEVIAGPSGHRTSASVRIREMSFYGMGTNPAEGIFFITGFSGTGSIGISTHNSPLSLQFKSRTFVQLATDARESFTQVGGDLWVPRPTVFRGHLQATIVPAGDDPRPHFKAQGNLDLYNLAGTGARLRINLGDEASLWSLANTDWLASTACAPENRWYLRHLKIQPVGVEERDRSFFDEQMKAAHEIWGRKSCFRFQVEAFMEIDPGLRSETDAWKIVTSYPLADRKAAVYVFITDGQLLYGGTTFHTSVVVANRQEGRDETLVAHELGHALRGLHPRVQPYTGYWVGDPKTVLKPSGSITRSSPTTNTLHNARRAKNPFPDTSFRPEDCCFEPDPPTSARSRRPGSPCRCR